MMDMQELEDLIRRVLREELTARDLLHPLPLVEATRSLDINQYLGTQPGVWEDPGDGNRQFWRSRLGRLALRTRDENGPSTDGSGGVSFPFVVEHTRDGAHWHTKRVPAGTVFVALPVDTVAIRVRDGVQVSEDILVPWDVRKAATGRDPR